MSTFYRYPPYPITRRLSVARGEEWERWYDWSDPWHTYVCTTSIMTAVSVADWSWYLIASLKPTRLKMYVPQAFFSSKTSYMFLSFEKKCGCTSVSALSIRMLLCCQSDPYVIFLTGMFLVKLKTINWWFITHYKYFFYDISVNEISIDFIPAWSGNIKSLNIPTGTKRYFGLQYKRTVLF